MRVLCLLSVWAVALLNVRVRGDFNWLQLGADIDGEAAGDWSGNSVSLSSDGNTVAIGAIRNDDAHTNAGHVRVYRFVSGNWTQLGADIDGEGADDKSGSSVSLSSDGNTVAILTPYRIDSNGHVRVYRFVSGIWARLGADINGVAADDHIGGSVSLSSDGTTVGILVRSLDAEGFMVDHIRMYRFVSGSWARLGADDDGLPGRRVSISSDGDIVAIGENQNENDGVRTNAGHVRVYRFASGRWTQFGAVIYGEAAYDYSSSSFSLSSDGTTVAIGAWGNDGAGENAGHVRVYRFVSGSWAQLGADIDGEAADDGSGSSVSLSSDGNTVAIGAGGNDGAGDRAGHVRLYRFVSGSWTQLGADIDGEAAGDYSGSVSLSSDGNTVAIGAWGNDGAGTDAGHVRVFRLGDGPAPTKAPTPTQAPTQAPTQVPTPTPLIFTLVESDIVTSVGPAVLLGIVLFFIWWRSGDIGMYEITVTWFALVDFAGDVLYILTQPFDTPQLFYTSVALLFIPPVLFALITWRLWLRLAVRGISSILWSLFENTSSMHKSFTRSFVENEEAVPVKDKLSNTTTDDHEASEIFPKLFSLVTIPQYDHYDKPHKLLHLGFAYVTKALLYLFLVALGAVLVVIGVALLPIGIVLVIVFGIAYILVYMLVIAVHLAAIPLFLVLLPVGIFLAVNLKITVAPSLQRRLETQNGGEEKRARSPFFFNLSVFVEVLGESIPQLVIISVNTVLAGERNGVFYFAIIGSVLAIINAVYFYLYWWCKLGSLWRALRMDPREDAKDAYLSEVSEISAQTAKEVLQAVV